MSYAKTVAELREMVRSDIETEGASAVLASYGYSIQDAVFETDEELVEFCVAEELRNMGK